MAAATWGKWRTAPSWRRAGRLRRGHRRNGRGAIAQGGITPCTPESGRPCGISRPLGDVTRAHGARRSPLVQGILNRGESLLVTAGTVPLSCCSCRQGTMG
jgi:hypothetical protein